MDSQGQPEVVLQGIAASQGIAYGQVFLFLQTELDVPRYQVEPSRRIEEVARFEKALVDTRKEITRVQAEVARNLGEDEARIFDAHLLVLEDQALISETIREFENSGLNIETCFQSVAQRYIAAFAQIDDEYLRERVADIRDVSRRLLHSLLGQAAATLGELANNRIVAAHDISPSEAASIDRSQALGIVTDAGSKTSHAVIVARSMRIPAVVGLGSFTQRVRNGDWTIVDGYDGVVILNPTEQTLFRYGKLQQQRKSVQSRIMEVNRLPAETLDGVPVALLANIEKSDETGLVKECFAAGVGLFRTEFLFLNATSIPTEEEQFEAYRAVAEALKPDPVVIRTLDIGGDKASSGGTPYIEPEANPFLGFRAIRFCLENPEFFKIQLRAILRASAFGQVQIMYPMISGVEEVVRANALLAETKAELRDRGVPFDEEMAVGSMIEIPSAASTVDLICRHVDFLSVGTNDLIQYLLAIDRVNNRIAHLYEPTHPAVLRTLRLVFTEARRRRVPVGVCGEMAGDPVFTPLLLGLGASSLSMTPPLVPAVKYLIRHMKMSDARRLAKEVLKMDDAKEIQARFDAFYRERIRDLTEGVAEGNG
jgi:phosphotransferase system enzyme I (PtsI)